MDSKAVDLSRLWRALRQNSRRPVDVGPLLAGMLAWARLAPTSAETSEGERRIGFLDPDSELTLNSWANVIATLRKLHPAPADSWIFADLEEAARATQPGELELYRQSLTPLWDLTVATPVESTTSLIDELFAGVIHDEVRIEPQLIELMVGVLAPEPGESVYCGFDLTAAVALRLAHSANVFAEIPSRPLAQILALLGLAGGLSLEVVCSDPILGPGPENTRESRPWLDERNGKVLRFDHAIALPPFGRRYYPDELHHDRQQHRAVSAATAEIHHLTTVLARGRHRRLTVVTDGFLFRTSKADQSFKEKLVTFYGLSVVVSLPRRVIGTGAGVQTSMMLLDTSGPADRAENVLFVDGRTSAAPARPATSRTDPLNHLRELTETITKQIETARSTMVPLNELFANEFNLSVDRYVVDPKVRLVRSALQERPSVMLGDVAELYRPQAIPVAKGEADDVILHEVSLGDIEHGVVQKPDKLVTVSKRDLAKVRRAIVERGDILLSAKGRVGVVGFVTDAAPIATAAIAPQIFEWLGEVPAPAGAAEAPWLAGQAFVIIRLRRSSPINNPLLLARYLASPFGQALMQSLSGGTTVPMIQMTDLRRLLVIVPNEAQLADASRQQARLVELRENIRALQSELRHIEENLWPMSLLVTPDTQRQQVTSSMPVDGHDRS
jgi:type I restriction enzyme M protein